MDGKVVSTPDSRKRGTKKGTKRGHYAKSTERERLRIITAAENGENWGTVAQTLGIKKNTAYQWIRNGSAHQKPRGGIIIKKLTNEHVEFLINNLNSNPLLTLKKMCQMLHEEFNFSVSVHTVARHLNGRLISLKTIHQQPLGTNSLSNKKIRKEYVEAVMAVR